MGGVAGVNWWTKGGGDCGQLGGVHCNGKERYLGWGGRWRESTVQRELLSYFDIKVGKVYLLS